MTLDDLVVSFEDARNEYARFSTEWKDVQRAGIRAVVEALRDDLLRAMEWADTLVDAEDVHDWINDILGGAGEKAAGGPTREDGTVSGATSERPLDIGATTPAADFCVWEWTDHFRTSCGASIGFDVALPAKNCGRCKKPIFFKNVVP